MLLPKDRIDYLLDSYVSHKIAAQEEQELMEWFFEAEEDCELKTYMGVQWNQYKPDESFAYVDWDAMFNRIVESDKVYPIAVKSRNGWWRRMAAAAAILILVSSVIAYFLAPSKERKFDFSQVGETLANDVHPGGNRAILKLADGNTIILDSAANGVLAVQGNTKITKLANGQIAYVTGGGSEVLYNTMSTPRGGQYRLTLPDGTNVWLNAASSITYPVVFIEKQRVVSITGEAYFEVVKDRTRPFHVKVNDMEVEVLGTHFNINAYRDENSIKTTVLEGSVKVTSTDSADVKLHRQSATAVVLKPGQQALVEQTNIKLQPEADLAQVMAWKNGLFDFSDADLPVVARQLERWYDITVKFEGRPPSFRFGGGMDRSVSLSGVIRLFDKLGIHTRLEDKTLIIVGQ